MELIALALILAAMAAFAVIAAVRLRGPDSDGLLTAGAAGLLVFLVALAVATTPLATVLRGFPAPTESWATIITGLAWPLVVLAIILRWSGELSAALASIARRIRDGESVKTPWLELPGAAPVDPADTTRRDVRRLLSSQLTRVAAAKWMRDNLPPGTDSLDFETSPSYVKQRAAMIEAVLA
jgi:hypothetical protein